MIFHLFRKDLLLFLKDKKSIVLTFLLPIILISLFAYAFGGLGAKSSVSPLDLIVVDQDRTPLAKELIRALDSNANVQVIPMHLPAARASILRGKNTAALILPKGWSQALETGDTLPPEIIYDQARKAEVSMLMPTLTGIYFSTISRITIPKSITLFLDKNYPNLPADIKNSIIQTPIIPPSSPQEKSNQFKMTSVVGVAHSSHLGLIQAIAGTAIMMLLFSVAALGTSLLEEEEKGTMNRLLMAPFSSTLILYSKMLFTFFIAVIQLIIMFVFAWLAVGLDVPSHLVSTFLMIVVTALAISSFGIFLAAVSSTRQQAQSLSTLIILIMSAVGGSMIPLFIMPPIMKKIAICSVNYWGIQGFYDIFWRNLSLWDILPRMSVLLIIGISMTTLSIFLFTRRMSRRR